MAKFNPVIPMQSLSRPVKSRSFEQPPEMTHPEDALQYHLNRINNVEYLDKAMTILEMGLPLNFLVDGMLRGAVMESKHGIDISLIIKQTLVDFIGEIAEVTDTPYRMNNEDEAEEKENTERSVTNSLARQKLDQKLIKSVPKSIGDSMIEADIEQAGMAQPEPEVQKGLMARV
tara:strand:+ start:3467 stop:3988 length:522 start_codon:yes stop_codon:yes gene_type:complete